MKTDSEFPVMTSTSGNGNGNGNGNSNGNDNNDKGGQVFEFSDQNYFRGQLAELINQIPPDYELSAAAQGASVKIPCSGTGIIEVSAPKFQILISPVKKNDH